jgi:aminoglycoside phosphotransferase (APT) family kinase protein
MANPWEPQRTVSPDLASSLIQSQFPDLAPIRVEPLGFGWDNTAYLVNGEVVFRFPRRQVAVDLLTVEARLLPKLAPLLPLPIPVPRWLGQPEERYPWSFAGYPMLPGQAAFRADLDDEARMQIARPLASFLRALHSVPLLEAGKWGAGPDDFNRLDVPRLSETIRPRLHDLAKRRLIDGPRRWLEVIDSASTQPLPVKALVHGDLHAEHLLVDNAHRLSGIIDWGGCPLRPPCCGPLYRVDFFSIGRTTRVSRFLRLD